MSRFPVYRHARNKQREITYAWLLIVFAVIILIAGTFFMNWPWKSLSPVVFFIFILWTGVDKLRNTRREYFFEVTPLTLEWLLDEGAARVQIPWEDIRWIKKESNGSISFFQDSSFNKNILLNMYAKEERTRIEKEIEEMANARQIKLLNFSSPVSELA